jgi:serine phosphatase RsbU (regulator of sigma subunit)
VSILEDKSGNLWFGTYGGGVSKYDGKSFTHFTDKEGLSNNVVVSILEDKSGNLWFGTRFGISKLTPTKLVEINDKIKTNSIKEEDVFFKNYTYEDGFLGIGCNGNSIYETKDGTIWIGANDRLTAMHSENMPPNTIPPNIQLTSIGLFNENMAWAYLSQKKDTILTLGNGVNVSDFYFDGVAKWYNIPENLSLAYDNNYLSFNFIGITMNQPKKVKYQYILEGNDENWSALTSKNEVAYGNLPHGTYTFKVKAMNSEGYWSEPYEYTFTIRPPWWKTTWFRVLYISLSVLALYLFFRWRTASLRKQKEKLEKTVEERTAEVVEQKHLIEEKHKEITDSINYAERIQRSFLATRELLDEHLKDYFVLFQPKDVVSGDFYWASKLNDGNFAYVTADSTGHGVPGAIMSILNISSLELAIKEKVTEPGEIFNYTRNEIINRLKKDGSAEGGKDGMDASLIVLNKEKTKLTYAAANNPVWILRNGEIFNLPPDKMPVGKHDKDQTPFTQQEFDLQKGDLIYSLTDGMPDQFGGPRGKKYKYTQLKEFLLSIAHLTMNEQKEKLALEFANWKGDLEQVDDVAIIGVRV